MRLDMAVQVKRAGVDDLVPECDPCRSLQHARRVEAISQRRRLQVEAAGYHFHCIGDAAVVEGAGAGADQVAFVAVLVDRVGRLSGRGVVEVDLKDDIDPCVVLCPDDEGRIVGVGVGCGVGVKEERRLVV